MGGGESKPAPPPTVIEQEPPAGSGESSIIYPERPGKPRLDGVTRALANDCSKCDLRVSSGISSSSVRLSREFGEVSARDCTRYATDVRRMREKQMSIQDFLGNLQAGRYLRNLGNGYCEQVELSSEEALKVTTKDQYDESKLRSVRIQKISSGGFSVDTKAKITPSIPFEMTFNGQKIPVKTMTVYHPCPLRLEGTQPDAVLSLNDPGFDEDGSSYIVLVPLVVRNSMDPSVGFFDKVLPQISGLASPDPTGQYPVRNIPTGNDWSLSKVFNVTVPPDGVGLQVTNGYYEWKGMPALEQKREDGPGTITYKWVESGKPSPRYIMLDQPVAISTVALSTITQTLPMTPVSDAIHAVLYDTNPLQRGIVHTQGACSTKEGFTSRIQPEEGCDAWSVWAQSSDTKGLATSQLTNVLFGLATAIAMAIGAYLALAAVLRLYDVETANFSEQVGKLMGVFAKSLKEKVGKVQSAVNTLRNPASLTGALGDKLTSTLDNKAQALLRA
jgi:hypothetical protein